jgi:hypothetical protein
MPISVAVGDEQGHVIAEGVTITRAGQRVH